MVFERFLTSLSMQQSWPLICYRDGKAIDMRTVQEAIKVRTTKKSSSNSNPSGSKNLSS